MGDTELEEHTPSGSRPHLHCKAHRSHQLSRIYLLPQKGIPIRVLHSPGSRAPHFKVYTFPKTLKCFPMEIPLSSKSPGNLECVSLRYICIQSNDGNITFYHCIYTCNGNYIYYYKCNGNKHLIMYQLCVTLKNS